jgi:hypothetical protein
VMPKVKELLAKEPDNLAVYLVLSILSIAMVCCAENSSASDSNQL